MKNSFLMLSCLKIHIILVLKRCTGNLSSIVLVMLCAEFTVLRVMVMCIKNGIAKACNFVACHSSETAHNNITLEWRTSLYTSSRTLFVRMFTSRRTSSYVITYHCSA